MSDLSDSNARTGRRTLLTAGAVAASTWIAGCTGSQTKAGGAAGTPSSGGATAARSASGGGGTAGADSQAALDTAARQAAQYDYDAAIATLAPLGTDRARSLTQEYTRARDSLQVWPDNTRIPHLFFHSMVVDPQRAFHGPDPAKVKDYDEYYCTIPEWNAIVTELHARGYVLVSPHDIARIVDGAMAFQEIRLPAGKKPLVLSQDDVSYYEYMTGDGFASDIHLRADGRLANSYTDASGKTSEGSFDMVPLLEDFLDQNPDFSYRGRRGVIAMTGYNGVLGYHSSAHHEAKRTDGKRTDLAEQQQKAAEVAAAMRKTGWEFASHSWGHIDTAKDSLATLKSDSDLWDAEVRPLVGDTDLYIFPFGADIGGSAMYDEGEAKFAELHGRGFTHFFPIDGGTEYRTQLGAHAYRQWRLDVDGIRLRGNAFGHESALGSFFDSKVVFDHSRAGGEAVTF